MQFSEIENRGRRSGLYPNRVGKDDGVGRGNEFGGHVGKQTVSESAPRRRLNRRSEGRILRREQAVQDGAARVWRPETGEKGRKTPCSYAL